MQGEKIMQTKKLFTIALLMTLCLSATSYRAKAQELAKKNKNQTVTPAASSPVEGSGTVGRLSKWVGVSGTSTYVLGDSNIFEDKYGKVGIGTTAPTSLLTVQGMIEITLGGLKFPDGTVQTTAALSTIFHDASLMGNGTQASPLGIANGGVQAIHLANGVVVRSLNGLTDNVQLAAGANITITPSGNTLTIAARNALSGVAHDATLVGSGTTGSPLGVAVPLVLRGPGGFDGVIKATNTSPSGEGIRAVGGDSSTFVGGDGLFAIGGHSGSFVGGAGVRAQGGAGDSGDGGLGVVAFGGNGFGAGHIGGIGILVTGGLGLNGATNGLAGKFTGNVQVTGTLSAAFKNFKIDHPLDPENKYLYHVSVESPDMKNIYDGNVSTDENGQATVTMPDYFEALNRDFRYQLTVIGTFAQAIVAEKIKGNRFVVRTKAPNVEVSWQVTGIRQDAFANKNRIPVEEIKPDVERGYYLHPEAFDQPEERNVNWARDPERMRQLKQRGLEAEPMPQPKQR